MSQGDSGQYCRVERLPWRKLDGQTVIVDPRTREVHVLNGTGSQIWDLLGQRRTVAQLVIELQQEFDADATVVRAEVEAFLQELKRKQLLAEGGSAPDGTGP